MVCIYTYWRFLRNFCWKSLRHCSRTRLGRGRMKTGDDRLWRYNSEDCCRTFEVDEALQQVVDKMGLRAPHDFQQSLFIPTLKAMVRGVRIDDVARKQLLDELQAAEAEAYKWLEEVIGH